MKSFGRLLLFAGATSMAFAAEVNVPEIDGSTAMSAVALLAGSVLILRARLRK